MAQTNLFKPKYLYYQGELKSVKEWTEIMGFKRDLINIRLFRGWPVARAIGEKLSGRGETHYLAKLTEGDVLNIIRLKKKGITYEELAETYGVCTNAIRKIINGESWKHLSRDL